MKACKRVLSVVLCAVLFLGCFGDSLSALALEQQKPTVIERYEMKTYRDGKDSQADYTYPTKTGYVFAGWYKEEACVTPVAVTTTTGYAYAKFVEENVLSVKGQLTEGADAGSENVNLRFVTTVDSLQYECVGFRVKVGEKTIERTTNIVYTSIKGYEDEKNVLYKPTEFSDISQYFMAYRINKIPNSAFLNNFAVTPIWKTGDGTTVEGVSRNLTVGEALGVDSVVLNNLENRNHVYASIDKPVKADWSVSCDVEVNIGQKINVSVLGNGTWNEEYYSEIYTPVAGEKIHIEAQIPEQVESVIIHVEFQDTTKYFSKNIVTVSSIRMVVLDGHFEENKSSVEYYCQKAEGIVQYDCATNIDVPQGATVSFDVVFDESPDIMYVWLFKDGFTTQLGEAWDSRYVGYGADVLKYLDKVNVVFENVDAVENLGIKIQFGNDNSARNFRISNIHIEVSKTGADIGYGSIWSAPSTVKVDQKDITYGNKGNEKLTYDAVRNEYESNQLLITAEDDIDDFRLVVSDLTNGTEVLAKENVEVYVQKYIAYDDTDCVSFDSQTGHTKKGYAPDALLPLEAAVGYGENSIKAGNNGGFWITVYVPKETEPGTYTGTYQLVLDGAQGTVTKDISVSVNVRSYILSDEVTAKSLFSWRYDRVAVGELDGSIEMMTDYYEFFKDYRISLQSLPLETLSGDEYAAMVQKYYDEISTYSLLATIGDISSELLQYKDKVKEQIFALAAASTAEKNLFDKAMIYLVDEPDLTDATQRQNTLNKIAAMNALLDECMAEITADTHGNYTKFKEIPDYDKIFKNIPNVIPVTTTTWLNKNVQHLGDYWLNDSNMSAEQKTFWETINCICPYYGAFTQNDAEELVLLCEKYGVELWWYGCLTPDNPAPTYHIGDYNLLSSRTVSWIQNKFHIAGNLYWDAAAYTDGRTEVYDQYIDVYDGGWRGSNTWPAGEGFLTYPGEAYGVDGPIPSLRLMSIRDGLEEYEILQAIEETTSLNMNTTFYNKIANDGLVTMYKDGQNGLNFTNLRKTLLDEAEKLSVSTAGTINGEAKQYQVQINQDRDLLTSVEKRLESELLFSFESYKDITGTRLLVGNQLGETAINKEQHFITEGKGSWMLKPQGDYGTEGAYPYFRMQCTDSTFTNSNFEKFDKLMMDVYNASDEEVTIKWSFQVQNFMHEWVETEATYYTLAPNAWTTCEFDLSVEAYSKYLSLETVKYMTITFMTKKDEKTAEVPTLYLDNLRGHYMAEERVMQDISYSYEEGITFANEGEQCALSGHMQDIVRMELLRSNYETEGITPAPGTTDAYFLKGDARGSIWPRVTAYFDKTYEAGSVLSFWMYVDVDEEAANGKTYHMESNQNSFIYTDYRFNTWMRVNIVLGADADKAMIFLNFDSAMDAYLSDRQSVQIYLDDFKIYADEEALLASATTIGQDGTVTVRNDFGREFVQYDIVEQIKKGSTLTFDVDFNSSDIVAIRVRGNGDTNYEYYAQIHRGWNGKQTIAITPTEDMDFMLIQIQYFGDVSGWSGKTCTISNIKITPPGMSQEGSGGNTEPGWGPIS